MTLGEKVWNTLHSIFIYFPTGPRRTLRKNSFTRVCSTVHSRKDSDEGKIETHTGNLQYMVAKIDGTLNIRTRVT